jgi:hypothetical protein
VPDSNPSLPPVEICQPSGPSMPVTFTAPADLYRSLQEFHRDCLRRVTEADPDFDPSGLPLAEAARRLIKRGHDCWKGNCPCCSDE